MLLSSCKKEIQEIIEANEEAEPVLTASKPCPGNEWKYNNPFYSYGGNTLVTYNNKAYVFDEDQDEIRVFDGVGWSYIQPLNDVPYFHEGTIVEFTIGNKAYLGFTSDPTARNAFFEYDFATNSFTRIADFPGLNVSAIATSVFSIGNRGYVVHDRRIWQYNPEQDTWTQKSNIPQKWSGRTEATGFSIGGRGYIVGGKVSGRYNKLEAKKVLEYTPKTDSWSIASYFPGTTPRVNPAVFVIGETAYIGGGSQSGYPYTIVYNDYYKYTPNNDTWRKIANVNLSTYSVYGFSINSTGYVVYDDENSLDNLVMRYYPLNCQGSTP
jgi:N-acetylneuraminic acid mutarotase